MSSGGGKASTPKLLDDNLKSKQFYRVLDLISEGPIYGPVDQSYLSSFMLNKTPITDSAGNVSVNGVSVAWRPGSEFQSPINGFSAIEATSIVNTEVTFNTPLVRTITDQDVTRVRLNIGVTGLVEQDTKGNQKNTSVTMVIETRVAGGAFTLQKTVTIGPNKISGEYLEAHVIEAPATKPFDIRVRRITPDSNSDLLSNGTIWNSYSQITDDNLNYPFSAIAGAVIDRDQYRDTPSRTYHLRGLIVDIPDNYDPITRTYSGLWTGGFKKAWTNNPAWLFRELVKNTRFGLARRAGYIDVDDGALYILSQYCDQPVNDGYGGKEPRMTLNAYITEQASARDILDKIAGMFRGIALWDGLRLTVMLDTPQDPVATITNANVVDGKFSRSSVKRAEKYNAVVVSWTDPDNGWEQVKEYVSDDAMIARGNYNETTLEAFGCTSRGQAWRAGKWLLETAKRESSRLTFQMARDAIAFTPGDVVEIMDNDYAGTRLGGRIVSHSGANITVDADVSSLVSPGDNMSLMGSSGKFLKYPILSVSGRVITLRSVPAWVRDGTVFAISISEISIRLFRILSIAETENNSVYSITAGQHDPNKQAIVDEGAVFEMPTDTLNGYRVPNIENLRILNTNSETVQVTATWETATTTKKLVFELYVYNESGAVVAQYETDQFRYDLYGLNAGNYMLGVRGRNENGMKGAETQVNLIIGAPLAPSSAIWTPGIFSADVVPVMRVTATSDTTFEFWYGGEHRVVNSALVEDQTQFLGRASQWNLHGLKADTTYYMYVRTRNAFGVSGFVEASGQASSDIPGMLDYIDEAVRDSEAFKNVQAGIDYSLEATMQSTLAQVEGAQIQYEQVGAARAEISQVKITIADADRAFAQFQELVAVQFGENAAEILEVKTAQATADEAFAEYRLEVAASFHDVDSSIVTIQEAQSSAEQAFAQYQTQVSTQFGNQQAAINQKLTSVITDNGTAKVSYTLNLGVRRGEQLYNTGFGMSLEPNGSGGYKSTAVFAADQFGIYSGSDPGSYEAAFFVFNGQVFLRSAFIQNASIDNAKIGQYIQSTTWDGTGNVGWHVNKNGFAYFTGVTIKGTVYASAGSFTGTVYATDGRFTGVVEASSFIGDVANGMVFSDTGQAATNSRSFQYVDSATTNLSKQIVVFAVVTHFNGTQGGSAVSSNTNVTININGSVRSLVVSGPQLNAAGNTTTTVMHSIRTTDRVINCTVQAIDIAGLSGSNKIESPTMLVLRGSGAFSQTA
ncbi:host specificity protein J [Atlantibacter sp. RC6]|uniref:host specificity protein J n=1 Tax=Atlantibacter sp. RC6 TaxID=2587036 RepID=UPI001606256F|nr:phage tail protein [Atlantibacter sp. RC6]MBB3323572.1 putative phage tail protein [Atlantibacter sp. RC6]